PDLVRETGGTGCAAPTSLWDHGGGLRAHGPPTTVAVRHLRPTAVPGRVASRGGPLPRDGQGPRPAVSHLQHGTRTHGGQGGAAGRRSALPPPPRWVRVDTRQGDVCHE